VEGSDEGDSAVEGSEEYLDERERENTREWETRV
jgi:hypothetical protein